MNRGHILNDLSNILSLEDIKENELLRNYTYTKLGGKADFLLFPRSYDEVQKLVQYANVHQVPLTLLGHGANVIIKDGGIRGFVISLARMKKITRNETCITAQSGAALMDVSRFALESDLSGLEFACGIPGSVGGAVFMNAGAYGGEIADVLQGAIVLTQEGELLHLQEDDLTWGYRTSIFAKRGYLALEGTFQLKEEVHATIKEIMDDLNRQRASKQPLEYPSCGSVFKRPSGYFAGKLIQDSGLQGKQIGGAQVSTKHAGFIVNVGDAKAKDYTDLIHFVQATVHDKFGVALETEVKIIGEETNI